MDASAKQPVDQGNVPGDLPEDIHISYRPERSVLLPSGAMPSSAPDLSAMERAGRRTVWSVASAGTRRDSGSTSAEPRSEFSLLRIIGRGGFGEVWEATQNSLGRIIAVKRMREDILTDKTTTPSTVQNVALTFRQEALTTAMLDHPNIVPVHDIGTDESGRTLLAMKLVRGRPWERLIEEDWTTMPEIDFLAAHLPRLAQMAQAVGFAHSRGIVHRDIKPSQVIVGEFGEVTLMDWGLAVIFDRGRMDAACLGSVLCDLAPTLDSAMNPAGTVAFMAPEQTEKTAKRIGPWTDIYLLGGTLYYLLTGTVPHRGPGSIASFYKAMEGKVEPPEQRASDREVPPELSQLCMAAMRPSPQERMQTAHEFIQGIENYLTGAGNREESIRLASEAQELLRVENPSYEDLARGLILTERAKSLWARNANADRVGTELKLRSAKLALRNSDLTLARLQAEQLPAGAPRDEVIQRVDAAENRIREAATVRHRLKWVSIILGILFVAGSVRYHIAQENARSEAVEAKVKIEAALVDAKNAQMHADEARSQAEQLVNFLVSDLSDELNKMGRLSVMQKVTDQISAYYQNRAPMQMDTAQGMENEVRALEVLGTVQAAQGRIEDARKSLQRSRQIAEQLFRTEPATERYKYQLGRIYTLLGSEATFQGSFDDSLQNASMGAQIMTSLHEAHPDSLTYKAELGSALFALSKTYYELGSWERAIDNYARARRVYEELVKTDPENRAWSQPLAAVYQGTAIILWRDDQINDALQALERAHLILQDLLRREPWNVPLQDQIISNHSLAGAILTESRRLDGALQQYEGALTIERQLESTEPTFLLRRLQIAGLENDIANVYRLMERRQDARALLEQASADIDRMLQVDSDNREALFEKARCHLILGRLDESIDPQRAAAEWNLSIEACEAMDINLMKSKSRFLAVYTQALLLAGRIDEGRRLLENLAGREVRDRDLFEIASQHGLLETGSQRFTIIPARPRPTGK